MAQKQTTDAMEQACRHEIYEATIIGLILPVTACIIYFCHLFVTGVHLYSIFTLCFLPPTWLLIWAYFHYPILMTAEETGLWSYAADSILDDEEFMEALLKDKYKITCIDKKHKYVEYITEDNQIGKIYFLKNPKCLEQ